MDERTIRYSNGEITVLWKPDRCIHSGICVRGLPGVFNVKKRPWINMLAATTSDIRAQVERCPSGALSWEPDKPKTS
ncbi:MAG: (4Fe-4S)-binding protein [Armatimonadota bacterium]|nr:(4Fe-4S)-binding protein [Armatimonadota bacterium]